jgi:hypothetical protein
VRDQIAALTKSWLVALQDEIGFRSIGQTNQSFGRPGSSGI